jgi:NAD(P)-dependent dehydrogenase (short-subunit alcohol dehydrogenase family)
MLRKPLALITGANGEIGHGLITRLAEAGTRSGRLARESP